MSSQFFFSFKSKNLYTHGLSNYRTALSSLKSPRLQQVYQNYLFWIVLLNLLSMTWPVLPLTSLISPRIFFKSKRNHKQP
ncbi:hypothetical protein BpHYR1_027132 [Brachionus plicatilis]|uniref:Uncharacterized protein n=1 Tax=Brachionus plicatilis TaxID=10195 RepID=A0A3M7QEL3_BRAPC|nr:hypothetical protein BpHYR1_027132 [Brachionus plicatilis]